MNRVVAKTIFILAILTVPAAAFGQLPVSPRRFVDYLNERCYKIANQPPLNLPLHLEHLNPLFVGMGLPPFDVVLGSAEQLCVPVNVGGAGVPPDTLPFVQYVDWSCYGITGAPLALQLGLTQLDPTIATLFGPNVIVTIQQPQQLCVPVVKNNANPPDYILNLVQYLDVACYGVDFTATMSGAVKLRHLNPLFTSLPAELSTIGPAPTQLCVPVTKNQQPVPSDIADYIAYSDVLCYPATGAPLNQNLTLTHVNPVLVAMGLAPANVFVADTLKLCVPVAKGGVVPPGIQ